MGVARACGSVCRVSPWPDEITCHCVACGHPSDMAQRAGDGTKEGDQQDVQSPQHH